jgi:alanine racemase
MDEAVQLRALPGMESASIYLMASVLGGDAQCIVENNIIPFATDTAFVQQLSNAAVRANTIAQVHLEIDTGIGRAGVAPENVLSTFTSWNALPGIRVSGICTHFTAADDADIADGQEQLKYFERAVAALPQDQLADVAIHAANSPAALRLSLGKTTFFRPGLLIYGIPPSIELAKNFPFKPVMSLKARVLLVRSLPKGTDVSYSRSYRLPHDAVIATIGAGYGDGYPRRLSNIGRVILPDGAFAPIRGRVCMDQFCIEIPASSKVVPGDIVTLIGKNGDSEIPVLEISEMIDTTAHEIPTCLTQRVKRVLV